MVKHKICIAFSNELNKNSFATNYKQFSIDLKMFGIQEVVYGGSTDLSCKKNGKCEYIE